MKKLSTFIIAAALIFGMAQCKKQEVPVTPEAEGNWVHISVRVGNGAKHDVYPSTGAVVYRDGDKVYVGNNGHYVGTLTYNSGTFSGDIYNPQTTDYLHFYFVGGLEPSVTLNDGSNGAATTGFTVNISDQSENLPVLSYGTSKDLYTQGTATYSFMLENKCALVEFCLTEGTNGAVTVSGMHTQAAVSFSNIATAITPTNVVGTVTLKPESVTSMWAILLPQEAVDGAAVTIKGKPYTANIPSVAANDYVHGSIIIDNPTDYVFTVDADGTEVFFAPGNLQATYDGTSWSWAFAANQWDYIGNTVGNTKVAGSFPWIIGTGTVDLFGWSSVDKRNFYGINNNTDNGIYSGDFLDWAVKADSMLLLGHTGWKTLKQAEWDYVLNSRNTSSGKRYAKAKVNDVCGVILLPDNWNTNTYSLTNTNTSTANYTSNTIDANQWTNLENAGAVFLPAAGYRQGTGISLVGSEGHYWSETKGSYNTDARCLLFNGGLNTNASKPRHHGNSVRLVRPAQ